MMRVAISNQYSLPFHTNVRRVIYNAHNDTKKHTRCSESQCHNGDAICKIYFAKL